MREHKYEPPRESLSDVVHAGGRSAVGAIPFFGQTAIEILNTIIAPPIHRRVESWRCSIAEAIEKLEQQQLCVAEQLAENELFIDTLIQASQAAVRTSQQDKHESLRNAVINSALPGAPDDARQAMFIQFVDEFSSLHLRILFLLDEPAKWFRTRQQRSPGGPPKTLWPIIAAAYPDLALEEALCERICAELHEKGLLIASSLRKDVSRFPYFSDTPREKQPGYAFKDELPSDGTAAYSGSPTSYRNWTTSLGRQFLAFITAPAGID